jgi:hypothetical protein
MSHLHDRPPVGAKLINIAQPARDITGSGFFLNHLNVEHLSAVASRVLKGLAMKQLTDSGPDEQL